MTNMCQGLHQVQADSRSRHDEQHLVETKPHTSAEYRLSQILIQDSTEWSASKSQMGGSRCLLVIPCLLTQG